MFRNFEFIMKTITVTAKFRSIRAAIGEIWRQHHPRSQYPKTENNIAWKKYVMEILHNSLSKATELHISLKLLFDCPNK